MKEAFSWGLSIKIGGFELGSSGGNSETRQQRWKSLEENGSFRSISYGGAPFNFSDLSAIEDNYDDWLQSLSEKLTGRTEYEYEYNSNGSQTRYRYVGYNANNVKIMEHTTTYTYKTITIGTPGVRKMSAGSFEQSVPIGVEGYVIGLDLFGEISR